MTEAFWRQFTLTRAGGTTAAAALVFAAHQWAADQFQIITEALNSTIP